ALVGLLAAGQFLDQVDDGGHTGGSTDQNHVVDGAQLDARVLDDLLEGGLGPLDQVGGQALELGAGELLVQVQRSLGGGRDVGQVDLRLAGAGEFDLGLLGGLTQTLQGHLVLGQVDALRILEAFDQPVDDGLVPVVTTEVVVTVGGLDLHDAVTDLQEGDVEGTTTEVVDEDGGLVLLLQVVGQGGRGRLVDDAQDVQARDRACFLGGLALGVAEVGGNGDDRVGDVLTQVGLGVALELLQHESTDLLRVEGLVVDLDGPVGADVAFDRADGPVDVGDCLALGDL